MDQLEARQQAGEFERLPKKEAAKLTEELTKLQATLGGIRKMKRLPAVMFIVDPHREQIAVAEANKLEIPVIGTGDTNVDPDQLDFIIPANDDAIRSIRLLCSLVAEAAIEGAAERANRAIEPEAEPMMEESPYDEAAASDELVAALAGGGALSFAPDDDDLLPGGPAAADAPPAEDGASPEEIAAALAETPAPTAETPAPAAETPAPAAEG
jgi:small subunit ribosomal protein S2